MAGREAVLRGNTVELTAIFLDAALEQTDPTDLKVSIYPPGSNPEGGAEPSEAWVYQATLTSGGSGPQSSPTRFVEKLGTGNYKYSFPVPADADLGTGYDRWEGTVDLEDLDETFTFVIVGGGSVGTTILYDNNIIFIKLASSVASTSGETLGEETTQYFTTTYDPLYSSVRRVRLDLGSLVSDIPDDTIMLAIFEASLMAAENMFTTEVHNSSYLQMARREYTTCLAELTLVQALLGDRNLVDRMSKTLGNLTVSRGGGLKGLENKAANLRECVARWQVPLQTGGLVTPEASLMPEYSVKGSEAEDAIEVHRQWTPQSTLGDDQSGANTDEYASGRRRLRSFRRRS